jgi:hypothetical protein
MLAPLLRDERDLPQRNAVRGVIDKSAPRCVKEGSNTYAAEGRFLHELLSTIHSYRSAIMGSTRVARLAGTKLAAAATAASKSATVTRVLGSDGRTP